MNHPLSRIFAPIFMIVFVAVIMVATVTTGTDNRSTLREITVASAVPETDGLPTIIVSESTAESP